MHHHAIGKRVRPVLPGRNRRFRLSLFISNQCSYQEFPASSPESMRAAPSPPTVEVKAWHFAYGFSLYVYLCNCAIPCGTFSNCLDCPAYGPDSNGAGFSEKPAPDWFVCRVTLMFGRMLIKIRYQLDKVKVDWPTAVLVISLG